MVIFRKSELKVVFLEVLNIVFYVMFNIYFKGSMVKCGDLLKFWVDCFIFIIFYVLFVWKKYFIVNIICIYKKMENVKKIIFYVFYYLSIIF